MLIKRKNGRKAVFFLAICLVLTAFASLFCGQIAIPVKSTISIVGYQMNLPFFSKEDFTQEQMAVIWYIRFPRMLIGLLVGGALGIGGAVMQGIFSNPLADPGIIGVSSGAATGAVLSIALGWSTQNMFIMPAFAFCGAIFAVILTVFLAKKKWQNTSHDAFARRCCRWYAARGNNIRTFDIHERTKTSAVFILDCRRT